MLINPIIPAPSADPWMVYHKGSYFFCENHNNRTIHVRQSKTIFDVGKNDSVKVWSPPRKGLNSKNVWAPELHFFNNKWFIYYAADDGKNENHRMWVLESENDDPFGKYSCRGCLETGGWAIDGTVLNINSDLYFLWSGWPGKVDGQQNLYIAPMANPYKMAGERVLISEPTADWERHELAVNEGPQILQQNGKTFLIYSASASWTTHYCLGMLELTGRNPLSADSWKKTGQVFAQNDHAWGVGHCSFVKSPCQTEDWILYHAKSTRKNGWLDRHVRTQRFGWKPDGSPDFGTPWPALAPLKQAA